MDQLEAIMRGTKVVRLFIPIILAAVLFGGFETYAETLFPVNPVISGLDGNGYTIRGDDHTSNYYDYTYYHLMYTKPWEPAPWNANIDLELYLFDTSDVAFTSFSQVTSYQRLMVDLKDDTTRANEPNFSWIEHSYDVNEASRAYNYMDYFYGYGSPDAELQDYDTTLDGNDLISKGDYIVLAEPFAYRIRITDVPAWEYASIKNSLFDYVDSIIGQYVPEETTEIVPETTVAEVHKDDEEEKTIKVIGRVLNSDIDDKNRVLNGKEIPEEIMKRMDETVKFLKAPSPNQYLIMSIVDFDGNELSSYGPILTDKEGQFEFEYVEPLNKAYDLFIVMPLGQFPEGIDAGPSIGVKDWVYTGGTNNQVILELSAEKIYKEDDEKEIDLEDLYISGGDTRRFISNTSKDTDFVNGFIYADSYLLCLMAADFYNKILGYELVTSKVEPLIIFHNASRVMPSGIGGNYDHLNNYINLSDGLSTWFGLHDMSTAVYHEFSHKVMFDLYGGRYPKADEDDWLIGTYGNQSTANSITEGFAYFMQNAISEYYGGEGLIDASPVYGHIEPNFPAWFEGGLHEARAVSGVLYDLYDEGRDGAGLGYIADDDSVVIPLKDLVKLMLEAPIDSVGQLHDQLILTYPDQKKGIDEIFIDHGFFSVAKPNIEDFGTYHDGEAFVDANRNFKYDAGETVINFNAIEEDGFRYQKYVEGAKIGYAAYSGNEARQMQMADPKFRIKTNSAYPVYAYDMTFIDEPYLNYSSTALAKEGYIQMPVLPYNHNMLVSIYPVGQQSGELFTMTSSEIKSNYASIMQQGYLAVWELEDLEMSTEYIPPWIAMMGGDYEHMQDGEQRDSAPFAQLSEYEFTESFIENPYVRPQEVVEEVAIVTEAPVEETTAAEVFIAGPSTDLVDSIESMPAELDSGSGLVDQLMDFIGVGSKGIIIILAVVASGSFLMLVGIIYVIVKLIKR